jgi:hypothetical protein
MVEARPELKVEDAAAQYEYAPEFWVRGNGSEEDAREDGCTPRSGTASALEDPSKYCVHGRGVKRVNLYVSEGKGA